MYICLHLKIISIIKKFDDDFYNCLNHNLELKKSTIETIRGIYNPMCCRSIYVFLILKKIQLPIILISNNEYVKFNNLNNLHFFIMNKLSNNEIIQSKNLEISICSYINNLISNFIIKLLSNKRILLFSGFVYGLKHLSKQTIKKYDSYVLAFDLTNQYIFFKTLNFALSYFIGKKILVLPIGVDKINNKIH